MKGYLQWLIDNQGKYEILKDNSYWVGENGEKILNKVSMSYKGTMLSFTGESGLIGAIEYFMEQYPI